MTRSTKKKCLIARREEGDLYAVFTPGCVELRLTKGARIQSKLQLSSRELELLWLHAQGEGLMKGDRSFELN